MKLLLLKLKVESEQFLFCGKNAVSSVETAVFNSSCFKNTAWQYLPFSASKIVPIS